MSSAPILSGMDAVLKAGQALASGQLVAIPTETVYGLGADATNDQAVAAIFAAKGRPSFNPLIIHVSDPAELEPLVDITPLGQRLIDLFWPGPLTLVMPRKSTSPVSLLASAGLDSLAVRMPASELARAIIKASGKPIAAPSANISGQISPTTAPHVAEGLGDRIALVVDGGPAKVGVESTVVDATGDRAALLRPGGIAVEDIEAALGYRLTRPDDSENAPKSPGMLKSHYAPHAHLRLNVIDPAPDEALIGFGPVKCALNLSPKGDLAEAAANLFAHMRALDAQGVAKMAVSPIPDHGLGLAINDRLKRAAAPRDKD